MHPVKQKRPKLLSISFFQENPTYKLSPYDYDLIKESAKVNNLEPSIIHTMNYESALEGLKLAKEKAQGFLNHLNTYAPKVAVLN